MVTILMVTILIVTILMVTIFLVTIFMVTMPMVTILMAAILMVIILMVTIRMVTILTRMVTRMVHQAGSPEPGLFTRVGHQDGSPGGVTRRVTRRVIRLGFLGLLGLLLSWVPAGPVENTHRGARTHDHKVKGLALCRLS